MHNTAVFEFSTLEAIINGQVERREKIVKSIQKICNTGESTIDEAIQAIELGDFEKCYFVIHSFKGMVANYGAVSLVQSLASLEETLNKKQIEQAKDYFDHIRSDFAQYAQDALAWCRQN